MKNIILIKQHPCIQLGHLYEHLFLREVNRFFYEKQLYKTLDYAATGTTFEEGGVIVVEVQFYTKEAERWISEIERLKVDMGPECDNIVLALLQMSAEETERINITNKDQLLKGVYALDAVNWQSIDDIECIDVRTVRKKRVPIYLTGQQQAKPRTLQIGLVSEGSNQAYEAAIFAVLARTLLLTASTLVANRYGYYTSAYHGSHAPLKATSELLVAPELVRDVDVIEVAQMLNDIIQTMTVSAVIKRVSKEITSTDYLLQSHVAPDFENILRQTRVMMGAKGWKKHATSDNIQFVLKNMKFEVRFGRSYFRQTTD